MINWISVKEKLPKHSQTVLVYTHKGFCVCIFIDSKKMNEELIRKGYPEEQVNAEEKPYYFCSQEIKAHTLNGATHWAELISPYN
jgi:hypothetical protein